MSTGLLASAMRTLRQPRYAALGALMLVVAIVCVAAGTWQIYRFESKRHANDALRANAHRAVVPVSEVLPVRGAAPSDDDVEFRQVTATGTYDTSRQRLVGSRTVGDAVGFLVVTPLRTVGGSLLIVRGFIVSPGSGKAPTAPPPPTTEVTVTARTHAPESGSALDPRRYAAPVYDGYAELEARQPGSGGMIALPKPDLSNPAGGALEPQHFAYVVQWFLFAVLALAAPFAMARAERRVRVTEFDDVAPAAPAAPVAPASEEDLRAAKLADRYGR